MFDSLRALPRNTKLALTVAAVACVWLISGIFSGDNAAAAMDTTESTAPNITISKLTPEPYTRMVTLIARSEADITVQISAQTAGVVESIPVAKGEKVTPGTTLLNIHMHTRQEDLTAAKAALASEKVQTASARKLHKEGFASDTTLAAREASLAAAEQQLAKIQQDIAYTHIQAPIAGILEKKYVSAGDYVQIGTSLLQLVGQDTFLITGFAAQQDRDLIQVGQTATAHLVNGQEVTGTIRFVASKAEETTRTYQVEMLVDGTIYQIPTGMTATLKIPTNEQLAYHLPHSTMVLADDGTLGVMLADDGIARFKPVTLLQDGPDGVWVDGLPATDITLITRGQAAVQDGTTLTTPKEE